MKRKVIKMTRWFAILITLSIYVAGIICGVNLFTAVHTCQADIVEVQEVVVEAEPETETKIEQEDENPLRSLGTFKLTAYCACEKCCGKTDGITATGTKATEGRTIAVDTRVIPYGTEVIIGGHTYVAEDCGGAIKGNKVDIFFENHTKAKQFGVQYKEVFVI